MSWIEVSATFPKSWDDLSPGADVFAQHGIENTLESGFTLTGAITEVDATASELSALERDLLSIGATEVRMRDLPEENWDQIWRQHFHPVRIGKSLVIRPSWEAFEPQPGDHVIELDPGEAFGTGDHATTRMCLELLEDVHLQGITVVDLGCGSGILSVAAKMLGAASVLGFDIEPVSVQVARENAARNHVQARFEVSDGLSEDQPQVDLLISNIISATLIRFAADAARTVRDGGDWIVSGIITQNWPDVLAAAEKAGFALVERRELDGWVAGRFRRVGATT
jgi:ribosomal protein L11 methyltransferase